MSLAPRASKKRSATRPFWITPWVPSKENGRMAAPPLSARMRPRRPAAPVMASSQLIGSNRPSPLGPTRRSGVRRRSGW